MSNVVNSEIFTIVNLLSSEKDISRDAIIGFIEDAFVKIAESYYGEHANIVAKMNHATGEIAILQQKTVVPNDTNASLLEINLADALKIDSTLDVGGSVFIKMPSIPKRRVLAGVIKNSILERIKSAEKEIEYNEFKKREGEIVFCVVKKVTAVNMIVSVGSKGEGIIFREHLLSSDSYKVGDRIKAYIKSVQRSDVNCQIILSRTDPNFVVSLMTESIVEVQDGLVEIKSIARESSSKTKIAVFSHDPRLDPISTCIGSKGSKIKSVSREINDERIDIIGWDRDIVEFAKNAISPAKAIGGMFVDELSTIELIVPDDQLRLAIGRAGQNVRLASKLVGCNITIVPEEQKKLDLKNKFNNSVQSIMNALGIEEPIAQFLVSSNINSVDDLVKFGKDKLVKTGVFDDEVSEELIRRAKDYIEQTNKTYSDQVLELGIDEGLLGLQSMTPEIAIKLYHNNIKTVSDVADLSNDELFEFVANVSNKNDINSNAIAQIIMSARAIAFGI